MRTVGRSWPKSAARGDYSAKCALCGFMYRRSQLVVMPGKTLRCSGSGTINCAEERDVFTLDQQNADGARPIRVLPYGGEVMGSDDDL